MALAGGQRARADWSVMDGALAGPGRVSRRRIAPIAFDFLFILPVALLLWLPMLFVRSVLGVEDSGESDAGFQPGMLFLGVALLSIVVIAVLLRHRFPVACLVVAVLASLVANLLSLSADLGVLAGACVVHVAERRERVTSNRAILLAGVIAVSLFSLALFLQGSLVVESADAAALAMDSADSWVLERIVDVTIISIMFAVLVLFWAVGSRNRVIRDDVAQRAEFAERLRLRREVHDVLSHSLSTIGMRAGVAAQLPDQDPAQLRELLGDIERDARRALGELREVLQQEGSGQPLAADAFPGVLEALRGEASAMGLHVDVELGEPEGGLSADEACARLPIATRAALHRIAQESVTNVIRHARARTCRLMLRWPPGRVEIEVRDDGRGDGRLTFGQGLTGMRERVSLLGGELRVDGAPSSGGFVVLASLPCTVVRTGGRA